VVPTRNESGNVSLLVSRLAAALEGLDAQVIFVDDSDDGTPHEITAAARESSVPVRLHHRQGPERTGGLGGAVVAGLRLVESPWAVVMDGDLQHPPELLAQMLDLWREGFDVVHTQKVSTEDLNLWRRLVTKLAYRAIRRVAQVEIIPEASDFRLLDRTALEALRQLPEQQRLYRGLTRWIGFRQAVLPYEAGARGAGSSRYGLRQLMQLFARAFFDFSNAPLHTGVVLGLATVGSCVAYVVYTVVAYLTGHHVPHGYVTLIFLIVLLSSINLTFSGILGVYLARVYDEVRRRPTYVVGRTSSDAKAEDAQKDLDSVRRL
jgi:polyisoprenyl-phosphate glycosyltransferase